MKVHHVMFLVKDIDTSIRFYTTFFGFTVVKRFEKNAVPYCLIRLQDFAIELRQDKYSSIPAGGRIAHLAFEVEDILKEIQKLKEKGLAFDTHTKGTSCSLFSFAKDPDGIDLELYQP